MLLSLNIKVVKRFIKILSDLLQTILLSNAKSAKKACDGIHHHHDESVPEDGAVELVVGAEGYQTSEGDANRVEHLGCSVDPYLHQN